MREFGVVIVAHACLSSFYPIQPGMVNRTSLGIQFAFIKARLGAQNRDWDDARGFADESVIVLV